MRPYRTTGGMTGTDALRLDTLVRPYKSLFVLLYYNGRTDRASLQDDVGDERPSLRLDTSRD